MDGVLDKQYAKERRIKKYLEFRYKERALAGAAAIQKYLSPRSTLTLVDLGAAEGLALLEMAKVLGDGEYIGIEYDQSLIASAPELPKNVRLIRGDVGDMSNFPDNSVDVITALALLEHLEDPIIALKESFRVLRPGGLFVATSPVTAWERIADFFGPKNTFGGEHHQSQITKTYLAGISGQVEFEFVHFARFMWVPVAFLPYLGASINPAFAWKIDTAIGRAKVLNWSFVNQRFVLKKPNP